MMPADYTDPHEFGVELAVNAMSGLMAQAKRTGKALCHQCAAREAYRQAVVEARPAPDAFWRTTQDAREGFLIDALQGGWDCGRAQ